MTDSEIPARIVREKHTISLMIAMWCRAKHGDRSGVLCDECTALELYAHARLDRCRYGARKSSCRKCPTHCYRPEMREAVRQVMRYAGSRMMLHHPIAALRHLFNI